MKHLFLFMLLLNNLLKADVISEIPTILLNMQISNINEYPDTKFIFCNFYSLYSGTGIEEFDGFAYPQGCYELKQNQIVKAELLAVVDRLLAIPKNLFESVDMKEMLQNHAINHDSYKDDILYKKSSYIPQVQYMEGQKYPIDEETRVYKITSVTDNNVTLKLEKRIIHFTNGEDNKTILY